VEILTGGAAARCTHRARASSKVVEKERVEQDEASTYWEDVEEESSREETEENFDDDDRREDDRELFTKGDAFEDVSEDTAEEEVMKQAEVPKSREGIEKELNSGCGISDDPGTMLGRVWEAKPDVDKEKGFEDTTKDTAEMDKDMVKQDKALFNREKVPEARTESTGKANIQRTGG
jgi:hypothetical protein